MDVYLSLRLRRDASRLSAYMTKRTIGKRIRAAREARGWSQPELGRKLRNEVTAATVYRWEAGRMMPSVFTLRDIATALGVRLTELIEDQVA